MTHKRKDEMYFQITLKEFSDLITRFSKGVEKAGLKKQNTQHGGSYLKYVIVMITQM